MSDDQIPAGWYPAPHANNELRYWDGTKWTELKPAPPVPGSAPSGSAPTPVPAQADQPKQISRGGCCGVMALVLAIIVGMGFLAVGIPNLAAGKPFFGIDKPVMETECRQIIADWAGIDIEQVTGFDRSQGTAGWDFGGTYPGGEWQCGGPAGEAEPTAVVAFPGGITDGTAEVLR